MDQLENSHIAWEATEGAAWNEPPALESLFGEFEETELAAELLGLANEAELDQFLGGLLRQAASRAGGVLKSSTGRALGGLLKRTIRRVLPGLDRAARDYLPYGLGQSGARIASNAGLMLGLELEGLSGEDQEFEVAKQIVHVVGAAARKAATAPETLPPVVAAKQALTHAAREYAPGLLSPVPPRAKCGCACHTKAGRWERRGREIILDGL